MEEYLQETFPSANIGVGRLPPMGAYNPLILYRKLPNSFWNLNLQLSVLFLYYYSWLHNAFAEYSRISIT